jgi:transposase-like protein
MPLSPDIENIRCKYCGRDAIVKCGSYKGTPRYLCKLCKRKFKNDNHAFGMSLPVKRLEYVLNSYYRGMKIDDIRHNMRMNFGVFPSAALIRSWIDKYTENAQKMVQNYHPEAGSTWVLSEMVLMLDRQKLWIYEVVDNETNYLLALIISPINKIVIRTLLQRASAAADINPKIVLAFMPPSRFKEMKTGTGCVFEHVPKETYADCRRIGISGNVKIYDTEIYRIRNLNRLRTLKTAGRFFNGMSIHYNYFELNENLKGKTPAEAAKIKCPYHSWEDIIENSGGKDISK